MVVPRKYQFSDRVKGRFFALLGIGYGYDLLERNDLDRGDNGENVNMPSEHGGEEATDHDECPYGASDEGFFFFSYSVCGFGSFCRVDECIVSRVRYRRGDLPTESV